MRLMLPRRFRSSAVHRKLISGQATDGPQATSGYGYQRSLTGTRRQQTSENIVPGRRIFAPPTFQAGGAPSSLPMILAGNATSRPCRCAVASRALLRRLRPRGGSYEKDGRLSWRRSGLRSVNGFVNATRRNWRSRGRQGGSGETGSWRLPTSARSGGTGTRWLRRASHCS